MKIRTLLREYDLSFIAISIFGIVFLTTLIFLVFPRTVPSFWKGYRMNDPLFFWIALDLSGGLVSVNVSLIILIEKKKRRQRFSAGGEQ